MCMGKRSNIKDEIIKAIFKDLWQRFTFISEMKSTLPAMKSINKVRAFERNAKKTNREERNTSAVLNENNSHRHGGIGDKR